MVQWCSDIITVIFLKYIFSSMLWENINMTSQSTKETLNLKDVYLSILFIWQNGKIYLE